MDEVDVGTLADMLYDTLFKLDSDTERKQIAEFIGRVFPHRSTVDYSDELELPSGKIKRYVFQWPSAFESSDTTETLTKADLEKFMNDESSSLRDRSYSVAKK